MNIIQFLKELFPLKNYDFAHASFWLSITDFVLEIKLCTCRHIISIDQSYLLVQEYKNILI